MSIKKVIGVWVLVLVSLNSFGKDDLKALYDSLDYSVAHKNIYAQEKIKRIDDIRSALSYPNLNDVNKYVVYNQLYNEYWKFDLDSAIHYARLEVETAIRMEDEYRQTQAEFQLATSYAMHGMYLQAEQILSKHSLETLPKDLRAEYYNANIQFLQYYLYTSDSPEDALMQSNYRDSLYATQDQSSIEYRLALVERMPERDRLAGYTRLIDLVERYSPLYARITYNIGTIFAQQGDRDEAKKYLIRSALSDIYNVTRENQSIYELARLVYEDGDYARAYRYAQSSFEDAITAGIQFRVAQVSGFYSIITDVYQRREASDKQSLINIIVLSGILLVCLIAAIFFIFQQLKKIMRIRKDLADSNDELQRLNETLNDMNAQLHSSNSLLEENNAIKEQYIGQFFNICSGYIDKIGDYQNVLYRLAVNKHYDELVKKLRSTTLIDSETEALYHHFDTIFLNLFPTFVADLNSLLREEERIVLKQDTLLNKELRIYALLRLGITDSEKIANFLRCSTSTIYNYRTKMRNRAIDKNTFEDKFINN
ncbi:MAG: DUF6377 domain-containing protein [Bacteroidaceae bacterium]|nr:DUF6377 domain-containing protein [Bacteroidaceae bacterium]